MIKKNLGGDRLGSGAKNNVELHEWHKSTHDLSKITRTTMAAGTIIPIFCEFAQQGDIWDIDLDALINTHPTEGPLFGSFKLQIDVFTAPIRLYIGKLHMNMLKEGQDMTNIKFPRIGISANPIDWTEEDINNQQINPSSIAAYLGIRGIGGNTVNTTRYFNATPWLMYYEVAAMYYANQQEEVMYIIHNGLNLGITGMTLISNVATNGIPAAPATNPAQLITADLPRVEVSVTGNTEPTEIYVNTNAGSVALNSLFNNVTIIAPGIYSFDLLKPEAEGLYIMNYDDIDQRTSLPQMYPFNLEEINEIKLDILADVKSTTPYSIDYASAIEPYKTILKPVSLKYPLTSSQEGLAVKTYQSDLFNNWLNTASIDAINNKAKISTTSGGFTMEAFLLMEKLYNYLNRVQLAGNTVDDWEEINWGKSSSTRIEKPIFEGGLSKELIFEEVVSNSASNDQPLGTLAGRGRLGNKHKGGKVSIKVDEHSIVMINASLTPRLDYFQGNKWFNNLKTLDDIHKPAFDRIGFQNLITDKMAFWDTDVVAEVPTFRSAGKQPSWIDYQTNYNEVYGNFAIKSSEGWMVLTRDYEPNRITKRIKDLTTYIDPAKWNDVFAYKSRDAQNFWAQFSIDAKVRRVMSANQIPGL